MHIPLPLKSSIWTVRHDDDTAHRNPFASRWFILIASSFALFRNAIVSGLLSPVFPQIIRSLGVEGDALIQYNSLVYALQSVGYFLCAGSLGLFSDRFSKKRKLILWISSILYAGALGILAFVSSLPAYTAVFLVFGWVQGAVWIISFAIMADVFPANQQGRVLGVLNFAYSLGRTFGPIVGGNMADGISLRSSLYLALGLSGIDFILTSLMDPEGACQHRQEKVAKKEVQSLSPLPVSTPPSSSIIQIIKVPSYLIVSAAYFLIFIAFLGFDSVYAIHLNTKFVMSPSKIGIITLAYTVSFTIFSLVAGYISDKIAKQHVVSTGLILQAVSAGLVFLAPSEVTVCVAMAAFGAAFSIATVPYYPLTVQIVTKAGLSNVLTKVSAMNGIISGLGQIAGPLFVGTVKNNELFFGIVGCLMLAYTPIVALHLWWFLRRGSSEGNMGIVAGVEKKEERDEPSPTSGSGEELGADLEANRRLSLETKTDLESRTTMVSSSKGEFSGGTSIGCVCVEGTCRGECTLA